MLEEQPHFNNFMVKVEQGYGSGKGDGVTNVYHSRRHAADVTQAVHYFLKVSLRLRVEERDWPYFRRNNLLFLSPLIVHPA